jgi:DNA-binding CsgD family transcriptional regulator
MLPLNRRKPSQVQQLTVDQLESRFGARFAGLTMRERQVCARAAIGMTVEATALDLGIAKTSVLTYRQRAYQRLSVTSPYQLCTLVTH